MASKSELKTNNKRVLILILVLALLTGIYSWFHFVYENPKNVFYGMLGNSLSTSSFTKRIAQTNSGTTVTQTIYLETGAHNITFSEDTQIIPDGRIHGIIQTNNVGTPTTDYSKFTIINPGARSSLDKPINYYPVIGVWAKNSLSKKGETNGQLFTNALLGSIIPIGNVTPAQKNDLMKYIKQNNVYILGRMKSASVNGRTLYTYNVGINLLTFSIMLNKFGTDLGMKLAPPNTSALAHEIETANVTIDALSRQLVGIRYVNSPTTEVFSSFGVKIPFNIPKSAIPLTNLETEVKNISGQ